MRNQQGRLKLNEKLGFTLVEVVVIIALLGTFIALAAPNFMEVLDKSEDKADAAQMDFLLNGFQARQAPLYDSHTNVYDMLNPAYANEDGTQDAEQALNRYLADVLDPSSEVYIEGVQCVTEKQAKMNDGTPAFQAESSEDRLWIFCQLDGNRSNAEISIPGSSTINFRYTEGEGDALWGGSLLVVGDEENLQLGYTDLSGSRITADPYEVLTEFYFTVVGNDNLNGDQHSYGLVFDYSKTDTEETYSYLNMRMKSNGRLQVEVHQIVNGVSVGTTKTKESSTVNHNIFFNQKHSLKMIRTDNKIYYYLDESDTPLIETDASTDQIPNDVQIGFYNGGLVNNSGKFNQGNGTWTQQHFPIYPLMNLTALPTISNIEENYSMPIVSVSGDQVSVSATGMDHIEYRRGLKEAWNVIAGETGSFTWDHTSILYVRGVKDEIASETKVILGDAASDTESPASPIAITAVEMDTEVRVSLSRSLLSSEKVEYRFFNKTNDNPGKWDSDPVFGNSDSRTKVEIRILRDESIVFGPKVYPESVTFELVDFVYEINETSPSITIFGVPLIEYHWDQGLLPYETPASGVASGESSVSYNLPLGQNGWLWAREYIESGQGGVWSARPWVVFGADQAVWSSAIVDNNKQQVTCGMNNLPSGFSVMVRKKGDSNWSSSVLLDNAVNMPPVIVEAAVIWNEIEVSRSGEQAFEYLANEDRDKVAPIITVEISPEVKVLKQKNVYDGCVLRISTNENVSLAGSFNRILTIEEPWEKTYGKNEFPTLTFTAEDDAKNKTVVTITLTDSLLPISPLVFK